MGAESADCPFRFAEENEPGIFRRQTFISKGEFLT